MDLTDKQERRFYVYALVDPRDGEPFYIGKGCRFRIKAHVSGARRGQGSNSGKIAKIRAIHAAGLKVGEIILSANLSEREALQTERDHISLSQGRLTNMLSGGGGRQTRIMSFEEFVAWARWRLSCIVPYKEWLNVCKRSRADRNLYWWVVRRIANIAAPGYRDFSYKRVLLSSQNSV